MPAHGGAFRTSRWTRFVRQTEARQLQPDGDPPSPPGVRTTRTATVGTAPRVSAQRKYKCYHQRSAVRRLHC